MKGSRSPLEGHCPPQISLQLIDGPHNVFPWVVTFPTRHEDRLTKDLGETAIRNVSIFTPHPSIFPSLDRVSLRRLFGHFWSTYFYSDPGTGTPLQPATNSRSTVVRPSPGLLLSGAAPPLIALPVVVHVGGFRRSNKHFRVRP